MGRHGRVDIESFGSVFGDGDSPRKPDIIAPGFEIKIYTYVGKVGVY